MRTPLPLLPYGTRVDALEARVAYHIRNLGLQHERPAGVKVFEFWDLKSARSALSDKDVALYAQRFGVEVHALSAELTPEQHEPYLFYQAAHAHREHVGGALKELAARKQGNAAHMARAAGVTNPAMHFLIH